MSFNGQNTSINEPSKPAQIMLSLVVVGIAFLVGFLGESFAKLSTQSRERMKQVVNETVSAEDATIFIRQNPNQEGSINLGLSVNEPTGIEFAYSFYLFINPTTFTGEAKFKHVLHKGYGMPWPLMGPGVFMHTKDNTMRVVMNTYKQPYVYKDITNIPVQKWFHVVLNCKRSALDIYINGTLANRIVFNDAVPYQNYQDLIIFSQIRNESIRNPIIAGIPAPTSAHPINGLPLDGAINGYISNVKYARYALSVHEISSLMQEGPSTRKRDVRQELPPYLADSWWANQV